MDKWKEEKRVARKADPRKEHVAKKERKFYFSNKACPQGELEENIVESGVQPSFDEGRRRKRSVVC